MSRRRRICSRVPTRCLILIIVAVVAAEHFNYGERCGRCPRSRNHEDRERTDVPMIHHLL